MTRAPRPFRAPLLALALAASATPAWALDLAREDVRAFAAEMKEKHGFDAAWLDAVLADAATQPRIIELISKPAEAVKPWSAYRDHFLTQERLDAGAAFWTEHREVIERVAPQESSFRCFAISTFQREPKVSTMTSRMSFLPSSSWTSSPPPSLARSP